MGDKRVETLGSKVRFSSTLRAVGLFYALSFGVEETNCSQGNFRASWTHVSPFPPKQCWFSYFFDCTDRSAYTTLNWGAGGIRELTLNEYRKAASFPKSVSASFVAHCRLHLNEQNVDHQQTNPSHSCVFFKGAVLSFSVKTTIRERGKNCSVMLNYACLTDILE